MIAHKFILAPLFIVVVFNYILKIENILTQPTCCSFSSDNKYIIINIDAPVGVHFSFSLRADKIHKYVKELERYTDGKRSTAELGCCRFSTNPTQSDSTLSFLGDNFNNTFSGHYVDGIAIKILNTLRPMS